MKKTDGLTRVISLLLFAAMLCYLGFAMVRRLNQPLRTAVAVEASRTETVSMSGLILRQESLVRSDRDYVDIQAADGQKIAAGGTVAVAYTSERALERAMQLEVLERQLQQAEETAESGLRTQGSAGAVFDALMEISDGLRSGSLSDIDLRAETLSSLLRRDDGAGADEDRVQSLQQEYDSLSQTVEAGAQAVISEQAGVFSSVTDGFEDLDYADALLLTPLSLEALLAAERSPEPSVLGKVVTSHRWYYAALMDGADAAALAAGQRVELAFERYAAQPLEAEVAHISGLSAGRQVVLFALDEALAETLTARKAAAELLLDDARGLRVPAGGLYRYWAGYLPAEQAQALSCGDELSLCVGLWQTEARISEIGEAEDGRCQIVVFWPWAADNARPGGPVQLLTAAGDSLETEDYYEYDPAVEQLCVFTLTGRQAERKKVSLVYAGRDYCLVSSQGSAALRAGNDIILQAEGLYHGKVFD